MITLILNQNPQNLGQVEKNSINTSLKYAIESLLQLSPEKLFINHIITLSTIFDEYKVYYYGNRNNHWNSIINKTDYEVEILFDEIEYDYAKIKEIEFISLYKRKIDGGTLCNITLGGEGALGIKHTEEAKRKISKARLKRITKVKYIDNEE